MEDVCGKNYDPTVMCKVKNHLSNLLGEKSGDVTFCPLRENLKQRQQEGHHREVPHRKTSQDLELWLLPESKKLYRLVAVELMMTRSMEASSRMPEACQSRLFMVAVTVEIVSLDR